MTASRRTNAAGKCARPARGPLYRDDVRGLGTGRIEQVGERYLFRFKMKGHLGVEQWLKPIAGGQLGGDDHQVQKFGVTVATSDAVIRKLSAASAAASARSSDAP